jgi:AraC-like DNA-binding protein
MRPYLEHIASSQDSSWTLFDRRLPAIPFEWHYNTEYELTLTRNSRGQRFIGDSIAPYDDGDLVLIGPRIPHTWCSSADVIPGEPHQALVLWFTQGLVESLIRPHLELHPILRLLDQSLRAVAFSDAARSRAQPIILAMLTQSPGERLPGLLQLLLLLAADREATLLTSPLPTAATESQRLSPASEERIGRVLRHLSDHYREEPSIAELARIAALSRSSLHRLFKLQTGATIHEHIARLRIGNACALLLNTDHPITLIADHVGYRNLAHFNRQFKTLKHRTPREFRRLFA